MKRERMRRKKERDWVIVKAWRDEEITNEKKDEKKGI